MKDNNTKFFHMSTMLRRKKNEIVQLKINEKNFHGVYNLKRKIRNYLANKFPQQQVSIVDFVMENHPEYQMSK